MHSQNCLREKFQHIDISSDVRVRKARKDLQRVKPRYEQKLIRSTFKDTTKAQGVLDVANADTSTSKGNKKKNIKKLPPCINSFYIQII